MAIPKLVFAFLLCVALVVAVTSTTYFGHPGDEIFIDFNGEKDLQTALGEMNALFETQQSTISSLQSQVSTLQQQVQNVGPQGVSAKTFTLSSSTSGQWECVDVNVADVCGGEFGCTIRVVAYRNDNIIRSNDFSYIADSSHVNVRGTTLDYMKLYTPGTQQLVFGSHLTSGFGAEPPMYAAAGYTFKHNNCAGQSSHGPSHNDPYTITLVAGWNVDAHFMFYNVLE